MLGGIWGCILSELKEYTPRPPKKNSGRDFDFPPRPSLKRPKEGPRPFLWKPSRGLRGFPLRRTLGRGTKARGGVPAVIQNTLPCGRRGHWQPGSSGPGIGWLRSLRGTGFGPPYLGHGLRRPNFVPKFGASVRSSAPTGGCGRLHQPSWAAGAQQSACASGREERAEIGAKTIPKGGPPPTTAPAALSEAESAEIAAGQIRPLPDNLRVQHGAESSEV